MKRAFLVPAMLAASVVDSLGRRLRRLTRRAPGGLRPQATAAKQVERLYPMKREIEILHRRRHRLTAERRIVTIAALRIWQDVNGERLVLLEGYCHMRQAPRRLRCDHIVELRDLASGRVVSGGKAVIAWLEAEAAAEQKVPVPVG